MSKVVIKLIEDTTNAIKLSSSAIKLEPLQFSKEELAVMEKLDKLERQYIQHLIRQFAIPYSKNSKTEEGH